MAVPPRPEHTYRYLKQLEKPKNLASGFRSSKTYNGYLQPPTRSVESRIYLGRIGISVCSRFAYRTVLLIQIHFACGSSYRWTFSETILSDQLWLREWIPKYRQPTELSEFSCSVDNCFAGLLVELGYASWMSRHVSLIDLQIIVCIAFDFSVTPTLGRTNEELSACIFNTWFVIISIMYLTSWLDNVN